MKKSALVALLMLSAAPVIAAENPPAIPFEADTNFLKMPNDMHLGEVSGVAVNSRGNIFVYHRGNTNGPAYGGRAAQLLEFDANGNFVREIGRNLYAWSFAHTVRVDREDNIWIADKGSDMVVKFNPQGRPVMMLGRKPEASDEGAHPLEHPDPPLPAVDGLFRQVTDVTWDPQGNIYVSDGYINSRVAKYDKDGNWLMQWGDRGQYSGTTAPPAGRMFQPHTIASDAQGNIYVGDRGNRRIQVFNGNGQFLRMFSIDVTAPPGAKPVIGNMPNPNVVNKTQLPGAPWALCITPGPNQVLYSSDAFPGRIYKLTLDGRLLGQIGEGGRAPGKFAWIHEIACPSENNLYVGELLSWRVSKLTLHPTAQQRAESN
jgi:DNA-binding beta-propeller fold protein YncE